MEKISHMESEQTLDYYIYELIYNKLGFNLKLKGSMYLLFCIEKVIENNWKMYECKLVKDIYQVVALRFETTPEKVERTIRGAIEITWKNMNDNIKQQMFSSYTNNRPSNMEFICTVYDYIQKDYFKNPLHKNNKEKTCNGLKSKNTINKTQLLEQYIYELMYNKLNFKHRLKGSTYLLFYIEKVIMNNSMVYSCSPTKEIYPTIASQFGVPPKKVERSIRNAIEVAWNNIDQEIKQEVFPIVKETRPTNTEAIYAICEYIKAHGPLPDEIKTEENLVEQKFTYNLRFELQKMLEDSYGLYSDFGITKLQIFTDSIMIAIQMNGVSDKEMNYIISKISEKYGLYFGTYELYDEYIQVDTITPLLYKMCKRIYNNNQELFPIPRDKTYIKTYLNILTEQIKNQYLN